MAITLHKADGFEHGVLSPYSLDSGVTGSPTIVTSGHRSGLRGLEINPSASTELVPYNTAATVVTAAFFVKFSSLPTADGHVIARIRNTNGNALLEWDNTNSKFRVDIGAASPVTGGPTITTGTWYRVVMELDTSTGTATVRVKVDSTTEFSNTNSQASLACIDVALGATSASTYTAIYDDLVISITDGDYEQIRDDWSDWEILSAIPTSDGSHNITTLGDFDTFTGNAMSNSTTNANTFIGHRPLQAANTTNQVIRQDLGAVSNYVEVLFENPSNTHANVGGVQTHVGHVEAAASGASLAEVAIMLSDNTLVPTTGSIHALASTEDPGTTLTGRKRAALAPTGGWDETKVDGLKARIGFADGAPDVNFVDLMLQIVYFATGAGGDQDLTGATFTKAPTFPASTITTETTLSGAVFTKAGTFPTGTIVQATELAGATFVKAPSFAAGTLHLEILGATFTKAGTFPAATLVAQNDLTGATFVKVGTFPAGQLDLGLIGAVFTKAPTFPTGSITSDQVLTGAVFTRAPTFPAGTIAGGTELLGATFQRAPSFPAGTLTTIVTITGAVFQRAPTFPSSSITSEWTLTGAVFVRSGTFPTGAITVGPATLSGAVFLKAPSFPTGTISGGGQGAPVRDPRLEDLSAEGNLVLVTLEALLDDTSGIGVLEEVE